MAELARDLAVRRQLLVALDQGGLRAGGRAAVFPRTLVHDAAEIRHIGLAQDIRDANQHSTCIPSSLVRTVPKPPGSHCGPAPRTRTASHFDKARRSRACW